MENLNCGGREGSRNGKIASFQQLIHQFIFSETPVNRLVFPMKLSNCKLYLIKYPQRNCPNTVSNYDYYEMLSARRGSRNFSRAGGGGGGVGCCGFSKKKN